MKLGYLKEAPVKEIEYADAPVKTAGTNSKGLGERASKYLGWKPTGASLEEEIPSIVTIEAKKLGLTPQN